MLADIVRYGLIAVVIAALLGVYLWDKRKRDRRLRRDMEALAEGEQQSPAMRERIEPSLVAAVDAPAAELGGELRDELAHLGELLSGLDAPPETGEAPLIDENPGETVDAGNHKEPVLGAQEPGKVIHMSVVAPDDKGLGVQDIVAAADAEALDHVAPGIFLRQNAAHAEPLFVMASMVEPGTIDRDAHPDITLPGVTLFMQLPGPQDALATFADLHATAERLAARLGAVLEDQNHSALTKQSVQFIREEIIEYRRQMQLAAARH